ncbi:hypothetical protein WJX72_003454 [[Myrmecia] bisecta]|uniref:U-box domain-containing protein n=1 Tax=[Myrmecia] bisecta TaxID=41462 RepID=A0AAW1QEM8_9CHLO
MPRATVWRQSAGLESQRRGKSRSCRFGSAHPGQVYEREAIEQYLRSHSLDPVTRMALPTSHLTPVYILRSRAMEYRDNTARACIEQACSTSCRDPSHPSNAYDMMALQLFAKGLFDAGYRDKAASVYYTLLQTGVDRTQQAELLRQCLACWTAGQDREPDATTFEKLAQFVEAQQSFTWGQIIDIVQEAGLGVRFTILLCEQLLFKTQRSEGNVMELQEWRKQKELLVKYVQIFCEDLAAQIPKPTIQEAPEAPDSTSDVPTEPTAKAPTSTRFGWIKRGDWRSKGRVAAALLAIASLCPGNTLFMRAVRVAPLLFMLNSKENQ